MDTTDLKTSLLKVLLTKRLSLLKILLIFKLPCS
ncbi:hypothetical protein A2U01_0000598, partial [Trifolium medium]|nr:hypothetical protein [Trifolium medium]